MVKAMHAAGIEVILDVVYNHTAEGNHLGPTLSFKGIDNAGVLPARRRRQALLHGLHGHRQLAQRAASALPAADHGLAALLGAPRCTSTASASTSPRRWPASSTTSTGSRPSSSSCSRTRSSARSSSSPSRGTSARAATRSATSRRSGPSGTASTATPSATSGAASRRSASSPSRLAGSSDLYEHVGPAPVRQHQLRHRARRLHAARSRVLQRQAQRGQRRGQPRRREPQPLVEPRRRGPDRRHRGARAAGPRAAQLHRDAAAQPGRADAAARRRARPHPAGQQQHLRPGQRADAGCTGTRSTGRSSSSPRPCPGCGRRTRRSVASASSPARTVRTGDGERLNDIVWLHPDGRPMEQGDWTAPGAQVDRDVPERPRHRRHRRRPATRSSGRPLPAVLQRRARAGRA